MLASVKTALRISDTEFDGEIEGLIDACIGELSLAGIDPTKIVVTDPLAKQAVITYCKANFGFDSPEAPRFLESFNSYKVSMGLSALYRKVVT